MKCPSTFSCPVEATLDLIGGKYKALILWHLIDNTLRFNEIGKLIPKATPKMLTVRIPVVISNTETEIQTGFTSLPTN